MIIYLIILFIYLSGVIKFKPNKKNLCFPSRVSALTAGGEERARQLAGVARDGGAGAAQGFLAGSVRAPWERAVTPANVPYYIKWVYMSILRQLMGW